MNRSKERKRNRLRGHDYSQNGYYFVTVCVYGMKCVLGEIIDGEMVLSKLGEVVENCLLDAPNHYEKCEILDYVVMPNHVHAVIFVNNPNIGMDLQFVGDRHACPLRRNIQLLPCIVGSFKSAVTKQIHERGYYNFKWQRSFYDHIIRNDKEYENISKYIYNNPINWNKDKYYK